jgi:hypothetical protein
MSIYGLCLIVKDNFIIAETLGHEFQYWSLNLDLNLLQHVCMILKQKPQVSGISKMWSAFFCIIGDIKNFVQISILLTKTKIVEI